MKSDFTLFQKGLILVSVPLFFELVFVGTLTYLLNQAEAEIRREQHARAITDRTNLLIHDVYYVKRSAKGFVFSDGHEYADEIKRLPQEARDIKELVKDNPEQVAVMEHVEKTLLKLSDVLYTIRDTVLSGHSLQVREMVGQYKEDLKGLEHELENELLSLVDQQAEIARQSPQVQARFRSMVQSLLIAGVLLNIFLAVALAIYFSRSTALRLTVLMDNTQRLARGSPLNPPLPGNDEIAHLDRVFADMSQALAAAARKERAVIQNAIDVICSVDAQGQFSAINPACLRLFGYAADELIKSEFIQLIHPEDREAALVAFRKLSADRSAMFFENRVCRKDGSAIDVLWSCQWSEMENSMFAVVHDMTERKELERLKQEFLAMASHDLRTPLCSIQAFHAILERGIFGELSAQGLGALQAAERNVSRLIALVNDILDMEKLESGKLKMELSDTTLSAILEQSVQSTLGFADQRQVAVKVTLSDAPIRADRDRLVQVVVNLVSNAVKFSPAGSTVTIAARAVGEDAEFSVTDQGRGIPEGFASTIFERFQQVKDSDAREQHGTGLGLSICKAIVEAHGGRIGVESQEGTGSSFWFVVPRQIARANVSLPERQTPAASS